MTSQTFIAVLSGAYLIGSVPTAFLFVRKKAKIDIRAAGSGNVGSMNVFDVTGSKALALTVGIIDGMKGIVSVLLALALCGWEFRAGASALIGAVIGHNYPVWLRFHGGRGLASAAGGALVLGLAYPVIWGCAWVLAKAKTRDILKSNVAAVCFTPVIVILLPGAWLQAVSFLTFEPADYWIFSVLLSGIFLLSHLDVLRGGSKVRGESGQ